ncbi:divergent polysaccharide deacetylase family protein [uncultured Aliiroseovarius sp.]|uniref:divergent polysaccharide deacetylase family protein n=1 Tax=uncultured Aliiroseovarius sp. TaxID=1658783 RepID=UPI002599177F|nr:divergent polysaccharide deacetylase family protein [uncultured Aliiroseovarius sp.]
MPKGFLSGVFWGSVVSALALAAVSLQLSPVNRDRFAPAAVDADLATDADAAAVSPDTQDAPVTAPVADTDEPAQSEAPQAPDTAPDAISAPDAPTDLQIAEPPEQAAPPAPDQPVADKPAPDLQEPETAPTSDDTSQSQGTAPAEAPVEDAPVSDEDGAAAADTDAEAPVTETLVTETPQQDEATAPDTSEPMPDTAADTPQIKSDPVAPIGDRAEGVTTNRLPTITAPSTTDESGPDQGFVLTDMPPLAIDLNATPFDNPEGRPLMSVVLFDQGAGREALGDLNNLPFPVSFIVDARADDAARAIAFYRNAGAEVIIAPTLPEGATPTDAEVIFQAQTPLLDKAVAVFMDDGSGFQGDSQLAAQVSEILVASGHGLVSQPQGLNTGHKTALKTGVASGIVFRELDKDGQDAKVIGRFLDNAAFKAGQEDGVIMLGQARVETLQALIEWSLGNRAKSVALAPISALLLGG